MATKPADFRQGTDGLAGLVRGYLAEEPFSGAVFVFLAKHHRLG